MFFRFRRKRKRNPDEIVNDRWKTAFGWFGENRFKLESGEGYSSKIERGSLLLELRKKNIFAWINTDTYIYRDFVLDAEVEFGQENGYSAVGFVFRYVNPENFYYFLLSNRGAFRFDVVFNRNPIHLIEWTENPLISREINNFRIIAHGSNFSFYIDDEWIAEFEDEFVYRGEIGFAAQNFDERDYALFKLNRISIDSTSIDVERDYYRWVKYIPPDPEFRKRLARTFFSMSTNALSYLEPAAVQMKKALRFQEGSFEDYLFYAEILLRLKLYDYALENVDKALSLQRNSGEEGSKSGIDARVMKANILYLKNDFIAARDYVNEVLELYPDNAILWGLLGNSEYALGNWDRAYEAYSRAEELEPKEVLFKSNKAKALMMMGNSGEALDSYIEAIRILFNNGEYDEAVLLIDRAKRIDPDNMDLLSFDAKILYELGERDRAKAIFERLIEKSSRDSSIYFMMGIIRVEEGDRRAALGFFRKAASIDPDYPLYWFRIAESEYILGESPDKVIEKALSLDPEEPWTNNLYGLILLNRGDTDRAEEYILRAYRAKPDNIDVIMNYSSLLSKKGDLNAAVRLVENFLGTIEKAEINLSEEDRAFTAMVYNHLGNVYSEHNVLEKAVVYYEKSVKLVPDNFDYLENLASACFKGEMYSRAEEAIIRLMELYEEKGMEDSIPPSVYNIRGNIAWVKGEYRRAEAAFKMGIERDSKADFIKLNLASMYTERQRYNEARKLVDEILRSDTTNESALRLLKRIRKFSERKIECAICKREWWVPKELPPQPPLRIVGEPAEELPAGKCNLCGRIYCVGCAKKFIKENRFTCPECGEPLKLSDDSLRYLWNVYLTKESD